MDTSTLLLFLAGLVLTVLIAIVLRKYFFRPEEYKFGNADGNIVNDPGQIKVIVQNSVDNRSLYDYEIMHPAYKEIYKGQVLGLTPAGEIEVERGAFTDVSLDFANQPARVAFHVKRNGRHEFYNFNTRTLGIRMTSEYGRQERVIRLSMPAVLSEGQKRRHIRVEPYGPFAFKVNLLTTPHTGGDIPLNSFRKLHQADISDISIGGLQCLIQCRSSEVGFFAGYNLYAAFRMPCKGLDTQNLVPEYLVQAEVVSIFRLRSGRRVMSREADEMSVGPHLIRLKFTHKGAIDRQKKSVVFHPVKPMMFEDLAKWINAFQRFVIQQEKDTAPKPEPLKNVYEAEPPVIRPRYPSVPYTQEKKPPES